MKKLNMEEKKKLEKLIESEIVDAEVLIKKREEFLKEKLVEEPSQAVEELLSELKDCKKDEESIESALKSLHFHIHYNGEPIVDMEHPEIIACKAEQREDLRRLKAVRRDFIVKLYSEEGGMEEVLRDFNTAIEKIVR
jgi:hypothetical protein